MNRAREPHLRMPPAPEVTTPPTPQQPPQQQYPAYPPQQQPPYDPQQQWGGYPPPQQPYGGYYQQPPQQQSHPAYQQHPVTTQYMAATQPMMQPPPPPAYDSSLDDPEPHAPRPSSWRVLFAIVGLIAIAGLSWLAYYWGPSYDGPPPLIPAPEGPYKVKPESPGGASVAYRDTLVYDRLAQHPNQSSGEQNVVILPDEPSMPAPHTMAAEAPTQPTPAEATPLSHMAQPQQAAAAHAAPPANEPKPAPPVAATPSAQQEMDTMLAKLSDIQELPTSGKQVYFLQMATLQSEGEAVTEMKRLKNKLRLQQSKWHVRKNESANGTQYVLLLGPYKTREEAKKRCGNIKNGCAVVAAE